MDYGDRPKEIMVFHDTAGLSEYGPVELRRPYIQASLQMPFTEQYDHRLH